MIAAKLPDRLYFRIMREAHHDAPLREEERITSDMDSMEQRARGAKSRMIEDEGFSEMREAAPNPIFE
jgi:hypothetical protein